MTRFSPLILLTAASLPVAASASVISMGSSYSKSCFEAAEDRDTSKRALDDCDLALSEEALPTDDRVATLVNRGILLLWRQNLKAANADFDAALRLNPRQPEAWLNKAIGHARFGKTADAFPMVAKALEYGTRKPALAYFVRAMAYEDSGNVTAAYRDLRRARQLDPTWKEPEIELRRYQVRQL